MNEVTVPALSGDQAATFLAALGTLSLLAYEIGDSDATLCWPEVRGPAHIGSTRIESLGVLAENLANVATRMRDADELLPGCGTEFPPRKAGKGTDPSRAVAFEAGREWAIGERDGSVTGVPPWLRSIFATNDETSPDHKSPGSLLRHPLFDAGPGTVSMSTTLENARNAATDEHTVRRSLTSGNRVAGSIGGYLDWRADRDASQAASARDKSTAFGDPVLTWLGLLSIRLTTLIADGDRAVCGLLPALRSRYLRKPMVWPVWGEPLHADEVELLLCHSALQSVEDVVESQPGGRTRSVGARLVRRDADRRLRPLGVHAVFAASRLRKGNNDGAYGPSTRLWPES